MAMQNQYMGPPLSGGSFGADQRPAAPQTGGVKPPKPPQTGGVKPPKPVGSAVMPGPGTINNGPDRPFGSGTSMAPPPPTSGAANPAPPPGFGPYKGHGNVVGGSAGPGATPASPPDRPMPIAMPDRPMPIEMPDRPMPIEMPDRPMAGTASASQAPRAGASNPNMPLDPRREMDSPIGIGSARPRPRYPNTLPMQPGGAEMMDELGPALAALRGKLAGGAGGGLGF